MPFVPVVQWDAPPVAPSGFGLLQAATPLPADGRYESGVVVRSINCETSFGTWAIEPCGDPSDPDAIKSGDRAPVADDEDAFLPVQVWSYDECDPQEPESDSMARARQTHKLRAPVIVEQHFAARLLVDTAAGNTDVDTFLAAVGLLEEEIGETGYPGFIHASLRFASQAANANLLVKSGAVWKTPLGNTWVFGAGYSTPLGDTLVATGAVYLWTDKPFEKTVLDPRVNRQASVVERLYLPLYECLAVSATIVAP